MRKRPCFATLAMLFALSTFSAADAQTLEVPFSTATETTNWEQSVSIQQFQPSLGTLDSVGFALSVSVQAQYSVSYTSTRGPVQVTCNPALVGSAFDLEDAGANLGNEFEVDTSFPTFSFFCNPSGSDSPTDSTSGNFNQTLTSSPVLDEFSGSGTISLTATGFAEAILAVSPGGASTDTSATAALQGDVIYTYTPVPEPGSTVMLGLGALILARRRSRKPLG